MVPYHLYGCVLALLTASCLGWDNKCKFCKLGNQENEGQCCTPGNCVFDLDAAAEAVTGTCSGLSVKSVFPGPIDCSTQVVLKATFTKESGEDCCPYCTKCGNRVLQVDMDLNTLRKTGFLFNVGDSETNDGYGGDADTQSNDAELHFNPNTLFLYAGDLCPRRSKEFRDLITDATRHVRLLIGNEYVRIITPQKSRQFCHRCLFALNGQTDREGNGSNFDIFIAFNRAISLEKDSKRVGDGVCNAIVSWVCQCGIEADSNFELPWDE